MRLFVLLGEFYDLGLADDRHLVTRVLPLVCGRIVKILVNCL